MNLFTTFAAEPAVILRSSRSAGSAYSASILVA
jgi:hypothetical protein